MRFYTFLTSSMLFFGSAILAVFAHSPQKIITENRFAFDDTTPVWEVLTYFGKVRLHKADTSNADASAEKGKDLVEKGWTLNPTGKKTKIISKFYVCASCHNSSREMENLADNDPQNRLDYAFKNQLPFLPASTFFGLVNRESFYNGDYQKKYGNLPDVGAAYYDVRKAIHVCATQHSAGRALEKWETESILLYFQTLQLKMGDLNLSEDDHSKIQFAIAERASLARAVDVIEARYIKRPPATFAEAMDFRTLDSRIETNEQRFENGRKIYELSCQHCHLKNKYAKSKLDNSPKTFQSLNLKMQQGHPHSIYKISRYGMLAATGKHAYMPQYTAEKMSNEQIIDLRVYIQRMAQKADNK